MSISQEFARLMGGDITVSSAVGEGSEFTFVVNLQKCEKPAHSAESKMKVIGLKSTNGPKRILIVDDGKEQRMILGHLLRSVGFEVGEANDGLQAIDKAQEWQPHFIWMDMRMPGMDGYEATRRIKKEMDVPIIALSASAFQEDQQLMVEAGCDDHITKPFNETDVFEILRKFLNVEYVYQNDVKETKK